MENVSRETSWKITRGAEFKSSAPLVQNKVKRKFLSALIVSQALPTAEDVKHER